MSGFLRVNTAPASLISVDEAKAQARITTSSEDTLISDYAAAASAAIDGPRAMGGRAYADQAWDYVMPRFCNSFVVPVPGATAVSAISYYDADNVSQTLTVGTYFREIERDDGLLLEIKDGVQLPSTYDRADAVTVTVGAGGTVPEEIKHAALLTFANWYEQREMGEVPMGAQYLINLSRKGWFGA